jgi:hypothetical protein
MRKSRSTLTMFVCLFISRLPSDADHSTMVKYCDNYDPHYITVRDRLCECVKKAPGIIQNRLARDASLGECMWICEV